MLPQPCNQAITVPVEIGAVAQIVINMNMSVNCNNPYPKSYYNWNATPPEWTEYGARDLIHVAIIIYYQTVIVIVIVTVTVTVTVTESRATSVMIKRFVVMGDEDADKAVQADPNPYTVADYSPGICLISYDCPPGLMIGDKNPRGPLSVTKKYPFGWTLDGSYGLTKTGVVAAIDEVSQWLEIQELFVSTDNAPRATSAKLQTFAAVQLDTRVSVTSGETSSGFSTPLNLKDIPSLPTPDPDA